ncbi:MAG TPA: response regulator [Anaerolineae bacterium]|nr:response regulator [Anaerolineae bacterium]HMR62847.1 response regulator [Anaerolineae bacterium]
MPNTILIVEDSDLLRRTLQWWLEEEFPGSRVHAAANAEEARRLAQTNSPDIVIIDAGPSRTSNLEVVELVNDVTPTTPIIVFTNYELRPPFSHPLIELENIYLFKKESMLIQLQSTLAAFLPTRPAAGQKSMSSGLRTRPTRAVLVSSPAQV